MTRPDPRMFDCCTRQDALDRTRMLLGAYRKGECEDPEIFVRSVASIFAAYPREVVMRVTDPLDGIQTKIKWLPSVAEVKEACEKLMQPVYDRIRDERIRDQNARLLPQREATPEERQRATDRWFNEIRPTMAAADRPLPETPEQARAKLRAMRPDLDDAAFDEFWISLGTHVPKTTFAPVKA
jgi:hypothetical protein